MHHYNWGLPLAIDLFAAGMGAAALMVAVMADLAGKGKKYDDIRLAGALVAPWPAILGVLLLVVDLGRPWLFWEMILRRSHTGSGLEFPYLMLNPDAAMSWGTWIVTLFVIFSLVYLVANIIAIPFPWGPVLTKAVGIVCLPFAILTATYPGVLIAATSEPLWHTVFLPMLFVASALVTGVAVVIFWLALIKALKLMDLEGNSVAGLEKVNSRLIIWQLVCLASFIIAGLGSGNMGKVIAWPFGPVFWLLVVGTGLVVPLVMGINGKAKAPLWSVALSTLVLVGGFLMRYVILIAGQLA